MYNIVEQWNCCIKTEKSTTTPCGITPRLPQQCTNMIQQLQHHLTVSEWVEFYILLDISGTSLSRQSLALVLSDNSNKQQKNEEDYRWWRWWWWIVIWDQFLIQHGNVLANFYYTCTLRENGAQHYAEGTDTHKSTEMQVTGNCINTLRNKTSRSKYHPLMGYGRITIEV